MLDVAIVGGGPVGMVLACLLVQRGLTVRVLEQRTDASPHSRAIGIHPPAIRALEQIGIADQAIAGGVRIDRGIVSCDDRVLGSLDFTEVAGPHPFVLSLPQRETERLLRDRLAELDPDALLRGMTVQSVRRDLRDDSMVIVTTDDAGADELRARYVVGADGTRSTVRTSLGIEWQGFGRTQPYIMADFPDDTDFGTTAVLLFERGGVVESFPLPGGQRRWVAMTDRLWTEASADDLAGLINDRARVTVSGGDEATVSTFAVQQHLAESMVKWRGILIGDAAHEVSPIGGQGMNLGWLDALALAPALEVAVTEPVRAREVLAEFEGRRIRSAILATGQAAFNMTMGLPVRGPRLVGRNALAGLLSVPPFRGLLASAFTMRWL